jgi:hypothetical protein
MDEAEVRHRGAHAACVVEEKKADGIDYGDGVLGVFLPPIAFVYAKST